MIRRVEYFVCDWCTKEMVIHKDSAWYQVLERSAPGRQLCEKCRMSRVESLRTAKASRLAEQTNKAVCLGDVTIGVDE